MPARTAAALPTMDAPGLRPVASLPGMGPALAETLARLGLERVQDLWFHLPLRYEDRTRVTPIADLRPRSEERRVGKECSCRGSRNPSAEETSGSTVKA